MSITVAPQLNTLQTNEPLTVVVVGASGDLAQTKVIPALFALFSQGYLPERFTVVGFARSDYSDDAFRQLLTRNLSNRCHSTEERGCQDLNRKFLERCFYCQGQYDQVSSYQNLAARLAQLEGQQSANRMFYMAIPPSVFIHVARAIKQTGLSGSAQDKQWTRVIIEKPFGSDRASSDQLVHDMGEVFAENQTFRIDYYLGKEVLQNLMVLRFANIIFEPLWNRNYIDHIQISWKEPIGVGNRAGYFDGFGIIRDVLQNHLLQMMALTAMEPPSRLDSRSIRDETVKVLRCVHPVTMDDVALGQYGSGKTGDVSNSAYLDELHVPKDSRAATFAAAVLHVHNWRWEGVPFFLRAGKALETRQAEIRIRFREVPGNIFDKTPNGKLPDELVIRVQPDETIYFKVVNKVPGLDIALGQYMLDMRYASVFNRPIPDAYECLLLEVLKGDKTMFVDARELEASWDIVTPVLHEIDRSGVRPECYAFGSTGPENASNLIQRYGRTWAN